MTPSLRFILLAVALLGAVGCMPDSALNPTITVSHLREDDELTIQYRGGKVTTTRPAAVEAKGGE